MLLLFGAVILYGLSVVNKEVDLRTAIQAKSNSNEASLDTMWKVISQKAEISQQTVDSAKEMNDIYTDIVQGRAGGALFKTVSEQYPDLGVAEVTSIYKDLMASVEAERKLFKREQIAIQGLVRERSTLRQKPVSGFFLSSFGDNTPFYKKGDDAIPVDHPEDHLYVWVTSGKTKVMVETGEENDVKLFGDE